MSARVMVVEDESVIAEDIRRQLVAFGYEVPAVVATGRAAMRAFDDARPDLVLMDIRLRGPLDGVDTAEALRAKRCVPIVFVTSHSDEATLGRAKQTTPHGYLLKPFTDRELRTSIEIALSKHEIEAKLEERERWLSTTLRSIGDAVFTTDGDDRITFLNAAAERLTGWSNAEAAGRPLGEVLALGDPVTRGAIVPPAARSLVGRGIASSAKYTLSRRDGGAPAVVDGSGAAIVADDGSLLGGVVVLRDVTERGAMEKRLAVSERLATVGTMAAGVAHEINNPLTYMTMNIDYALAVLDGGAPTSAGAERMREALEEAREGAERVRKIVGSLHRFARVDASTRAAIDPCVALEAALRMTVNVLRHKARLERAYAGTPLVMANEGELVQVFANLLANAHQAIPDGDAAQHEVRVATSTDEAGRAVIEVRDTGCGIPPQHVARVFDPFFTTKAVGEGTGLGLSISHGIVTALGGEITVASEVGVGTAFRVVLPPARVEA